MLSNSPQCCLPEALFTAILENKFPPLSWGHRFRNEHTKEAPAPLTTSAA